MLTAPDSATVGKTLVRRLIDEVMNNGDLDVPDDLYTPDVAGAAGRWITPFPDAFPDVHMEIVQLVAEGDTVIARFRCSGTHLGAWRGHPPTGRRFRNIDEVYFFAISGGRISSAFGDSKTPRGGCDSSGWAPKAKRKARP